MYWGMGKEHIVVSLFFHDAKLHKYPQLLSFKENFYKNIRKELEYSEKCSNFAAYFE